LDARISLSDQIALNSNLALSQNKIEALTISRDGGLQNLGDTNIAFSPNVITTHAIEYTPNTQFRVALVGKYVGEQYLSNTDTEASKLESYFVGDLNLNYELKLDKVFKSIVFSGMINNLFDAEYVDRGYTYLDTWSGPSATEVQGYYPQATRNFLAGVILNF